MHALCRTSCSCCCCCCFLCTLLYFFVKWTFSLFIIRKIISLISYTGLLDSSMCRCWTGRMEMKSRNIWKYTPHDPMHLKYVLSSKSQLDMHETKQLACTTRLHQPNWTLTTSTVFSWNNAATGMHLIYSSVKFCFDIIKCLLTRCDLVQLAMLFISSFKYNSIQRLLLFFLLFLHFLLLLLIWMNYLMTYRAIHR